MHTEIMRGIDLFHFLVTRIKIQEFPAISGIHQGKPDPGYTYSDLNFPGC